ncbi:hypothetical protein ES703_116342 [subsurface metagenome]
MFCFIAFTALTPNRAVVVLSPIFSPRAIVVWDNTPKPPASLTATHKSVVGEGPIGAVTIGCLIPNILVIFVSIVIKSLLILNFNFIIVFF